MKNRKKLFIFLIGILVLVVVFCVIVFKQKHEDKPNIQERGYYSFFDENGVIKLNISDYVVLPDNYNNYQGNSVNAKIGKIINDSVINVPEEMIKAYKEDMENMLIKSAEKKGVTLGEYIMDNYGITSIDSYTRFYEEEYIEKIKNDLIYQALAKDMNIKISKKDVKEYFKEALDSGMTYDDLKYNYGEKLMYLYTIENAVNTKIQS